MLKYKKEFKILISIIINPKHTFNTEIISSYKESNMNKLFLLITIPLAIISIFMNFFLIHSYSLNYISAGLYAIIITLFAARFLVPLLYYVLFKYIGKIDVIFEDVRKSLFPIIIVQLCLNFIVGIILIKEPTIKSLGQLGIYLWFLLMVSIVIKYRYMRGIIKTLMILGIPIIIYGIMLVYM